MFIPSSELLFQYGATPEPVVDWKVSGTATKPAPGEVMMSAQPAAGIRIAAAKSPNFSIVSPIGSLTGPFGNGRCKLGPPHEYHLSLIHISQPTRQAENSYAVLCL